MFRTPILFLVYLLLVCKIIAQVQNVAIAGYPFSSAALQVSIANSEKRYPTIVVQKDLLIEYTSNGDELQREMLIHEIKYINDDRSVEQNNKVYLSLEQKDIVKRLQYRVIQAGKVIAEMNESDMINTELENRKYKLLALKGVVKGTVIESIIAYRLSGALYDEFHIQNEAFTRSSYFHLRAPSDFRFNCKVYNYDTPNAVGDTIIKDNVLYFANVKNLLPVSDEKYAFPQANAVRLEYNLERVISKSFVNSKWADIGGNYYEFIFKNYEKNEKAIGGILEKAGVEKSKDLDHKIFAIESYLKTAIAIDESAPEMTSVKDALKRKVVSSSDMVRLLAYCFRKASITNEIVLTIKKQFKRFDPDMPSYTQLRNVLFYFPATSRIIEPEESLSRYTYTEKNFTGQGGVFIKSYQLGDSFTPVSYLSTIPSDSVSTQMIIEDFKVTFDAKCTKTNIAFRKQFNGQSDFGYRLGYYLVDDKKKEEILKEIARSSDENAVVTEMKAANFDMNDYDQLQKPFDVSARISSSYYTESAENQVIFKIGDVIGPQVAMYDDTARVFDIDISFPHGYNRTIEVAIPEGFVIKGLDKLNMDLEYADNGKKMYGFKSSYVLKNNLLTVSCIEYYAQSNYNKKHIKSYTKVINAAADFNKITLLLQPK